MAEDKMSKKPRDLIVLLGIALAVLLIRAPVLSSDFPLVDGGFFYAMAQDIQAAEFALPYWASYNQAAIPFVYPPLGLYLAALINRLGPWSLLDLLRWLPLLFNLLAVPAVYRLARVLLGPGREATYAMIAFVLLPESFRSYLMGGGITRAPGFLFAVLALGELASVYPQPRASHVILSALFAGLTILSHPLMTWFLAISAVVFFLALGRSRPALSNSLVAAGGAVALSAPWWITVLIRHGLDAFLAATNHGWPTYTGLLRLLLTGGTSEPFLPILLLMALLGGVVSRRTKHGWIVAWWVALFVFDTWLPEKLAIAPLALLAGLGLTAGLERLLSLMLDTADGKLEAPHPFPQEVRWLRIGVLAYGLFAAMYAGALTLEPLSTGEQQAMQWAAQNTEPESCFLVLSGDMWSRDRSAEWFPALAERTSVATVQGSEWIGSGEFDRRRRGADEARKCVVENAACLESWIAETGAEVTDVYVAKRQPLRGSDYGAVGAVTLDDCCLSLRASLDGDLRYTTIYDGPDASIYKRSAGP